MKKIITLALCAPMALLAQNYITVGTDGSGDDHGMDAKSIEVALSAQADTLLIRVGHYVARGNDFGYALALDTNNNVNDGATPPQHNLQSQTPNTSLTYDVMLYGYQNGFFPTVYTESYDAGGVSNITFELDTIDANHAIFKIPLQFLGYATTYNILAFTGSFDIAPSGAGPSDVMPNSTYATSKPFNVSLEELRANLALYPNPAQNYIKLDYNGTVQIKDATGKTWLSKRSQKGEPFELENLPPGSYFLFDEEGKPLGRFQKQ